MGKLHLKKHIHCEIYICAWISARQCNYSAWTEGEEVYVWDWAPVYEKLLSVMSSIGKFTYNKNTRQPIFDKLAMAVFSTIWERYSKSRDVADSRLNDPLHDTIIRAKPGVRRSNYNALFADLQKQAAEL